MLHVHWCGSSRVHSFRDDGEANEVVWLWGEKFDFKITTNVQTNLSDYEPDEPEGKTQKTCFYEEIRRYSHIIVYMVFFCKHDFIFFKLTTSYVTILY